MLSQLPGIGVGGLRDTAFDQKAAGYFPGAAGLNRRHSGPAALTVAVDLRSVFGEQMNACRSIKPASNVAHYLASGLDLAVYEACEIRVMGPAAQSIDNVP